MKHSSNMDSSGNGTEPIGETMQQKSLWRPWQFYCPDSQISPTKGDRFGLERDLSADCGGLLTEDILLQDGIIGVPINIELRDDYVDDRQTDVSGVAHLKLVPPDHCRERPLICSLLDQWNQILSQSLTSGNILENKMLVKSLSVIPIILLRNLIQILQQANMKGVMLGT